MVRAQLEFLKSHQLRYQRRDLLVNLVRIDHESTAPPAAVASADIGTPLVSVNGFHCRQLSMEHVVYCDSTVVVALPPVLLAVIV